MERYFVMSKPICRRAPVSKRLRVRVEAVRSEEIVGAVAGQPFADPRCDSPRVVAPPGEHRARGCNREDLYVCVGSSGRLGRPFRGLLELAQPDVGGGPAAQHREQQGVERAELPRMLRRRDRSARIADLTVKEPECVVPECEVRAQLHASLQLSERPAALAAEPQGSAHRPVRGGIAIVGVHAPPPGSEGELESAGDDRA